MGNAPTAITAEVVPASISFQAARFVENGNVMQLMRGAAHIDFGPDAERIVRRWPEVAKLCIKARKSGWWVVWC